MTTAMATFLTEQAAQYDDQPMLRIDGRGRTYGKLHHDAQALARGLHSIGLDSGTRVGLLMNSSAAAIDAWLATALLGCVESPFNINYRGSLLLHLIEDSEVEFVICDVEHLDELTTALAATAQPPHIIVNGGSATDAISLQSLYLDPTGWSLEPFTGGEVILYTSGTTGPSKGVVHNQRGTILLARYVAEVCAYTGADRLLNFFPLYHQNARYTGVLAAIAAGARIDLESRFTSSRFWELCRERGITAFNYLGSVVTMILNASPDEGTRDHPVRIGWGAGCALADRERLEQRFGIELVEVYGLTEAPMATVNLPGGGSAPGSAGRASRFFEVRVVDDDGRIAAVDQDGDIQVRPKIDDVFTRGYYGNAAATVAATQDLWFHTGDRGHLSTNGDVFFAERAKDSLRRRGENISAWEVESVLTADPRVLEAAVYGVAVDGDEEVMAALELASPDDDPGKVVRDVAGNLPRYAVPRFVRAVTEMPRTPTLKVQKAVLKAEGITPDTHDLMRRA